jgi:hypothetical protein
MSSLGTSWPAVPPPPPPGFTPIGTPGAIVAPAVAVLGTAATAGLYLPWMLAQHLVDLAAYRGYGIRRRWGLLLGLSGAAAYLVPAEVEQLSRAQGCPAVRSLWAVPGFVESNLDQLKLVLLALIYLGWLTYAGILQAAMNRFWAERQPAAYPEASTMEPETTRLPSTVSTHTEPLGQRNWSS